MIHVNKNDPELGPLEEKKNPSARYSNHRETIQLSEEELKVYKKCSNESLLKAGVPFAVIVDALRSYMKKKQGEMGTLDASSLGKSFNIKRGMIFIVNIIFGSFLYTPVCYRRLKEFHEASERKRMAEQVHISTPFEGSSVKTQPEDFSYPTDHMTTLGDSDSSFSIDFNPSVLILQEDEKPKIPQTTYDELRSRNREQQGISKVPYSTESPSRLSTPEPTRTTNEPPPRRVRRNKYGDEME